MKTVQTYRYGTVLINGSRDDLTRFAVDLRRSGYGVGRPNSGVLCVDDVSEEELNHITTESLHRGCFIESTRGGHYVEEDLRIRKAEKTDLQEKTWYFSEGLEDSYPFVFVRSMETQAMPARVTAEDDDNGDEDYDEEEVVVVAMDLMDAEGNMPRAHAADARDVRDEYGLRLATEEDFEERDLPTPVEIKLRHQREAAAGEPDKDALDNFGGDLL
jgi:hypothetical protein